MAIFTINRIRQTKGENINPLLMMFDSRYELPYIGKQIPDEVTKEEYLKPNPYFFGIQNNIKGVLANSKTLPSVGDDLFFIDEKKEKIVGKSKVEFVSEKELVSNYGIVWDKYFFIGYSNPIGCYESLPIPELGTA